MGQDPNNAQLQRQHSRVSGRGQGLDQIQEQTFEDARSDASGTVIMRAGQQVEEQKIPYGAEKQAIGNQLELASMIDDHNSVMNSSPVKSTKVMSRRGTKVKT